jgi:hypothetical protein
MRDAAGDFVESGKHGDRILDLLGLGRRRQERTRKGKQEEANLERPRRNEPPHSISLLQAPKSRAVPVALLHSGMNWAWL